MDPIIQQVRKTIRGHTMVEPGETVLLSLSAGKDSMAMLDIMYRLRDEFSFNILCFHLNHKQRGEESDLEEAFVYERAEYYNVPLYSEHHDFTGQGSKQSFEQFARAVRYDMLESIALQHAAGKIATAHNRDDHVETVLMRIFSGTAIAGLRGIPYTNGRIIRPLLDVTVTQVYTYLKKHRLPWCEDSSNKRSIYLRNRVRNDLVPVIQKIFPQFSGAVTALSQRSTEQMILVKELVGEQYGRLVIQEGDTSYIRLQADGITLADNKYLLFYLLAEAIRDNYDHFVTNALLEEVYKNLHSKRTNLVLYSDAVIIIEMIRYKSEQVIKISRNSFRQDKDVEDWEYTLSLADLNTKTLEITPIGVALQVRIVDCNFYTINNSDSNYVFIDLKNEHKELVIRNRRVGDRIKIRTKAKKIKDLLIEKKLDNNSKNFVPILLIDQEIVAFCPGLVFGSGNRVSQSYFVHRNSKKILAISRSNTQ